VAASPIAPGPGQADSSNPECQAPDVRANASLDVRKEEQNEIMLLNCYRILLIEEDSSLAQRICDLVPSGQDPDFHVMPAKSLQTAAPMIAGEKVDLLLLGLPVHDSQKTVGMIEIRALCGTLSIVVLVPKNQEGLGKRFVKKGAAEYLLKETLNSESLRMALCRAIERNRAETAACRCEQHFQDDTPLTPLDPSKALKGVQTGTETILLVEDAEPLRTLTKEILEHSGYTVLEAGNGIEAIQVAHNSHGPIHLLLTDVIMPVMGGEQLSAQLTRIRPNMKVLYMSGYPNDGIALPGMLASGVMLLEKPFSREILMRRVRQALDGKQEDTPG
jgi:CheY-like chemotaxis protein